MAQMSAFERATIVWKMEARSLNKLMKMDEQAFNEVVKAIVDCKKRGGRLLLTGKSTSGAVAKKVAHSLCCVDIPAIYIPLGDGENASMGLVQKGDLVILFSKGGSTKEVLRLISSYQEKGAKIVGVTNNPASPLALRSDILMRVPVEREVDENNNLATASTITMISAFDAVAVAILDGCE